MVRTNLGNILFGLEISSYSLLCLLICYQSLSHFLKTKRLSLVFLYFYLSISLCILRIVLNTLLLFDVSILASCSVASTIYALVVSILTLYAFLWWDLLRNRKYVLYRVDVSSSFKNTVISKETVLVIGLNVATYISMIIILIMFSTSFIEPDLFIYLRNVYLQIYRFLSRMLAMIYLFIVKLRALRQINLYSLMRPTKLICGIYMVLFIMLTTLLFYLFVIIIFIPKTNQSM